MTTQIDEISEQIGGLSVQGRVRVLEFVVRSLGGTIGVESDPTICGGEPRIVRSRIPIWTLQRLRELGSTEADILRSYPSLHAEDLVNAWAYVDTHNEEIAEQIQQHEEAD